MLTWRNIKFNYNVHFLNPQALACLISPLRSIYHQQCIQVQILIYEFQGIWSKFINVEKKYTATFGGI